MLHSQGSAFWNFADALSDGVYGVDPSGFCTFVNTAALTLLGYGSAAELLGRHMHDAIHHTRPDGSPYPADTCPLLQTLRTGQPVTLGKEVLWRKDGSCFIADYASYPIRPEQDAAIEGSVVVFRDLSHEVSAVPEGTPSDIAARWGETQRQQADEHIHSSEARFRTLADSIPQMTWMTGPDGAIDWYNRRWYDYTGTTFADMRGWGWKSVHHPDHVDRVVRHITEAFQTGVPWEDTFPLRGRDGTFRWFLSRATPIRGKADPEHPSGRILGWFGTNTDVTELRETEERLQAARQAAEDANTAKSDFIANMSHELRTPLSAIIGYSEMMREEMEDGAPAEELVPDMRKVEVNARHLLGLINDVLDLSKIESGRMDVFAEPFDIAAVLREILSTGETLAARKQNVLKGHFADDLGTMHTDVTKLRQVLLNFISNAAKFTESGTITLSATRISDVGPHDWLTFRVEDTGIGMTDAQLSKLFQRFTQADASTTRRFGGTGLGLAISKAFSLMLGGDIAVESEPGRGTSFSLILPARLEKPEMPSFPEGDGADEPVSPLDQLRGKGLVLVIDDDAAQRDLLGRFLARQGFGMCFAEDGPKGIALARALRPKIILLDIGLPGVDGWSVLTALKADPIVGAVPVVMVSSADGRSLAHSLGAAEYVAKPVDWSRLKSVMDRFRDTSRRVLVVEDDTDARRRLRHALERDGWTVSEAGNGADGLAQADAQAPDVVVLDLLMPIMDGFSFINEFRRRPAHTTTPVVVLTASDLTQDDRSRLRTASQVLQKGDTGLADLARELNVLAARRP